MVQWRRLWRKIAGKGTGGDRGNSVPGIRVVEREGTFSTNITEYGVRLVVYKYRPPLWANRSKIISWGTIRICSTRRNAETSARMSRTGARLSIPFYSIPSHPIPFHPQKPNEHGMWYFLKRLKSSLSLYIYNTLLVVTVTWARNRRHRVSSCVSTI